MAYEVLPLAHYGSVRSRGSPGLTPQIALQNSPCVRTVSSNLRTQPKDKLLSGSRGGDSWSLAFATLLGTRWRGWFNVKQLGQSNG